MAQREQVQRLMHKMEAKSELDALRDQLREFVAARDWDQFHSPKNLAMALSVEAGELLEHFQWMTEEQSRCIPTETLGHIEEELADVLLYLIRLADVVGLTLGTAAEKKMKANALKYPVEKSRGSAKKYTEL